MTGSITDVGGIRVGQHHRLDPDVTLGNGWASGTTVVLTPPGTVGAVDGRGGAPGTRETDLLDPINSVRHVDAVVLSGGSAYGLAAADGVMSFLEEQHRGVAMEGGVVPIVPAAVVFDLPVGGWQCRPTAEFGYVAAQSAGEVVALGSVGAGTGARVHDHGVDQVGTDHQHDCFSLIRTLRATCPGKTVFRRPTRRPIRPPAPRGPGNRPQPRRRR